MRLDTVAKARSEFSMLTLLAPLEQKKHLHFTPSAAAQESMCTVPYADRGVHRNPCVWCCMLTWVYTTFDFCIGFRYQWGVFSLMKGLFFLYTSPVGDSGSLRTGQTILCDIYTVLAPAESMFFRQVTLHIRTGNRNLIDDGSVMLSMFTAFTNAVNHELFTYVTLSQLLHINHQSTKGRKKPGKENSLPAALSIYLLLWLLKTWGGRCIYCCCC